MLHCGTDAQSDHAADVETTKKMVATIKAKFKSSVEELAKVLQCLDTQGSGVHATCCQRSIFCPLRAGT